MVLQFRGLNMSLQMVGDDFLAFSKPLLGDLDDDDDHGSDDGDIAGGSD